MIESNICNYRYCSIHENNLFPSGQGAEGITGIHQNIYNLNLPCGTRWDQYSDVLINKAIPFLQDFSPDLVIVSAGSGECIIVYCVTLTDFFLYVNNIRWNG